LDSLAEGIIWYVVFVFSTTLHEAAHALAALKGGDSTAYEGGQVTIDPMPHIRRSPFGMVLIPIVSLVTIGFPFGFASAPYNVAWARLYPKRAALKSLAGPGANFGIMVLAGLLIWVGIFAGHFSAPESANFTHLVDVAQDGIAQSLGFMLSIFFTMNLILFVFNMLPVPPLDGASVIPLLLSDEAGVRLQDAMASPAFSFIGIVIAWNVIGPAFGPIFSFALNVLYPGHHYR
jgi:Zn-dependent protease